MDLSSSLINKNEATLASYPTSNKTIYACAYPYLLLTLPLQGRSFSTDLGPNHSCSSRTLHHQLSPSLVASAKALYWSRDMLKYSPLCVCVRACVCVYVRECVCVNMQEEGES